MTSGSFRGELIVIGEIRRAVGLTGICAVETFGATLSFLKAPVKIWLGRSETTASAVLVTKIQKQPGRIVCAFDGVDSREQADGLKGYNIYIEKEALPELPENEYYHFELKNMSVYFDSDESNRIGTVQEVYNYPTIDAIEMKRVDGSTLLIPLGPDSVVRVDKGAGKIIVSRSHIEDLM